jgi:AhpD family alkylhydroperoxidase
MMKLDDRVKRLIAVGASVSANCQPCLLTNATKALEEGLAEQEIGEAIEVGLRVRQGAASKMDAFISGLKQAVPAGGAASTDSCGCG